MGCQSKCCSDTAKETKHLPYSEDMANCTAIVMNDSDIFIWDAQGHLQVFTHKGSGAVQDLCFSSHGNNADDFLTPCFDEDGMHGVPEEGCFCGLDAPHLHAHMHDPVSCGGGPEINVKGASTLEAQLEKLAGITLYLSDVDTCHIPLSKDFPRVCNSQEFSDYFVNKDSYRRLGSIQHEDHEDHLIHDLEETGHVHLQHACCDCKGMDCHGVWGFDGHRYWNMQGGSNIALRFYRAATLRSEGSVGLEDVKDPVMTRGSSDLSNTHDEEKSPCCSSKKSEGERKEDCCASDTCSSSKTEQASCCAPQAPEETEVSSSCCDSSGPTSCCASKAQCESKRSFRTIDMSGSLDDFQQNEPEKSKCCSNEKEKCCGGDSCCAAGTKACGSALHLEEQFIDANLGIKKDSSTKRSTFYVEKICCATEVAAIRSIVGPLAGVENLRVNATSKMLYVNHDVDRVSAAFICDALNEQMFGARIEQDGALETSAASSFVTSILTFDDLGTVEKDTVVEFLTSHDSKAVQNVVVDADGRRITVAHNALLWPASEIAQSLSLTLGVQTTVLKDGKDSLVWEFSDLKEEEDKEDVAGESSAATLRPTVVVSGVLWLISMLSFIGGNWEYLKYVAVFSVAFGLPPIAMKAALSLRRCRFDVNCLMAIAAFGALALQEFTEAAAVTFLFALSEWLEARATSRARMALSAIIHLRPEKANLIHPQTGELVVVPAGAVPVGALVSVKAGDKIPCDGVVLEGTSTIDESSLTGESRPVRKGPNDAVSGGTINSGNTQMTVRTTASAEDSAVARLIRLVEEAQANRSETEKLVDEFARIYTPLIIAAALAMCTIPWAWGHDVGSEWTELGLVLIVVACPCALIISTPVSYVAGLAATAQRGVLINGGAHLEALGLVKTVCFDKTGTLTQGKFQMLHFEIIGDKIGREDTLECLALMEDRASHPLARALVEGAQNEGVKIPKDRFVRSHTFLAGEGVSGTIDEVKVYVGNVRLFERLGLYSSISESERKMVEGWEAIGTIGFMSMGDKGIVCAYCVADAVRPESAQVLVKLREMGIHTLMLTGDKKETALSIGAAIGLSENDIRSELLPEEKLSIVSELKDKRIGNQSVLTNVCSERRLVLMCGDGVNDAPALAISDVGVAVAGSALAMETADVTLMDSHLDKLVYSIKMGRSVIRKIKQNVVFSLVVKFLVLGFALAHRAALWAAIASDVGAMLAVTINSMMLLPSNGAKHDLQSEEPGKREDALVSNNTYDSDVVVDIDRFNAEQKEKFRGRPEEDDELLSITSV